MSIGEEEVGKCRGVEVGRCRSEKSKKRTQRRIEESGKINSDDKRDGERNQFLVSLLLYPGEVIKG